MLFRKIFIIISAFVAFSFLGIATIDLWVTMRAKERIFSSVEEIPPRPVAMVLGTSKFIGRTINPFYSYRINAAQKLYENGKVDALLLSGDNAHRSYNEPWTMKRDMLKAGISEDRIYLDYAGFRTLDSIIRAKEVFEIERFILVTQAFHCERALFIADFYNVDAICLAVPSPEGMASLRIRAREVLARVKAVLDIYVLNKQPKFLGPKETISLAFPPKDEIDNNINDDIPSAIPTLSQ